MNNRCVHTLLNWSLFLASYSCSMFMLCFSGVDVLIKICISFYAQSTFQNVIWIKKPIFYPNLSSAMIQWSCWKKNSMIPWNLFFQSCTYMHAYWIFYSIVWTFSPSRRHFLCISLNFRAGHLPDHLFSLPPIYIAIVRCSTKTVVCSFRIRTDR